MPAQNSDQKFTLACQKPVIREILITLKNELPRDLSYHNQEHTLDVLNEALLFASHDNLPSRDIELLEVAVAFHDSGFLDAKKDNEDIGAKRAVDALKKDGTYTDEEILLVKKAILDTSVVNNRQVPTTRISPYLLDADMSNLGRADFFEKGRLLQKELGMSSEDDFLKASLEIMNKHEWYSAAAKKLRATGKEANIKALRAKLGL
jgi:predicted metal-dependent HD superfamily phosphohydrolase